MRRQKGPRRDRAVHQLELQEAGEVGVDCFGPRPTDVHLVCGVAPEGVRDRSRHLGGAALVPAEGGGDASCFLDLHDGLGEDLLAELADVGELLIHHASPVSGAMLTASTTQHSQTVSSAPALSESDLEDTAGDQDHGLTDRTFVSFESRLCVEESRDRLALLVAEGDGDVGSVGRVGEVEGHRPLFVGVGVEGGFVWLGGMLHDGSPSVRWLSRRGLVKRREGRESNPRQFGHGLQASAVEGPPPKPGDHTAPRQVDPTTGVRQEPALP